VSEEDKIKKRHWLFVWLREKIGLNALAIEFYKTKAEFQDFRSQTRGTSNDNEKGDK